MSASESIEIEAVLKRLTAALGATTAQEVAEEMGVSPHTLRSWRHRGSIPYEACIDVAQRNGISLDWLLTGKVPESTESHSDSVPRVELSLSAEELYLVDLYRSMARESKAQLRRQAEALHHQDVGADRSLGVRKPQPKP